VSSGGRRDIERVFAEGVSEMGTGLEQRLSLITLGVEDLERSTRFYREVLGWTPSPVGAGQVTFFQLQGFILGLFPRDELAADAGVGALEGGGHSRVALAYNVREREHVDDVLAALEEGGARIVKPAEDAVWGGRSGYFADPDGFLWEVAWNPGFPIDPDGSTRLPE
jgi:catechol 2,3-dioxygenase-like lactoylglutathione lyase family enzyme